MLLNKMRNQIETIDLASSTEEEEDEEEEIQQEVHRQCQEVIDLVDDEGQGQGQGQQQQPPSWMPKELIDVATNAVKKVTSGSGNEAEMKAERKKVPLTLDKNLQTTILNIVKENPEVISSSSPGPTPGTIRVSVDAEWMRNFTGNRKIKKFNLILPEEYNYKLQNHQQPPDKKRRILEERGNNQLLDPSQRNGIPLKSVDSGAKTAKNVNGHENSRKTERGTKRKAAEPEKGEIRAKKRKIAKKLPTAKKRKIPPSLKPNSSQSEFFHRMNLKFVDDSVFIPVESINKIYKDFRVDLRKIVEVLPRNASKTGCFLYENFCVSHVSSQVMLAIMKRMRKRPKLVYDLIHKLTSQLKVISEDFNKDDDESVESPSRPKRTLRMPKRFIQESSNEAAKKSENEVPKYCSGIIKPLFRPLKVNAKKRSKHCSSPPKLPKGWKTETAQNGKVIKVVMISPTGLRFKSLAKALNYIKKTEGKDKAKSVKKIEWKSHWPRIKPFRKYASNDLIPKQLRAKKTANDNNAANVKMINARKRLLRLKINQRQFALNGVKPIVPTQAGEGWFSAKTCLLRHLSRPQRITVVNNAEKTGKSQPETLHDRKKGLKVRYSEGSSRIKDLDEFKGEQKRIREEEKEKDHYKMESELDVAKRIETYTDRNPFVGLFGGHKRPSLTKVTAVNGNVSYLDGSTGMSLWAWKRFQAEINLQNCYNDLKKVLEERDFA